MSRRALHATATLLAAAGAAAVGTAVLAASPASATEAPSFSFPHLGTVVVTGTVDDALNYTVYRITNPDCTGTDFPGPDNSCVPQEATDTLVIPPGTYDNEVFELRDVPECGPSQQDVYDGAYQPTITASGTHHFLAGGIVQLDACATTPSSPAPSPSESTPTGTPSSTTSTPTPTGTPSSTTSTTSTPVSTTPGPVTTSPKPVTVTTTASPSSAIDATGSVIATVTASDTDSTPASTYVAYSPTARNLASTGAAHTGLLVTLGVGALATGGLVLAGSRRRGVRQH